MNDFRCRQCNRLLARIQGEARVEIKCPRCKTMNLFSQEIFITIKENIIVEGEDPCTDPEAAEN
jgi:phage FluMu protein Com